jgi:hypothetical protein
VVGFLYAWAWREGGGLGVTKAGVTKADVQAAFDRWSINRSARCIVELLDDL